MSYSWKALTRLALVFASALLLTPGCMQPTPEPVEPVAEPLRQSATAAADQFSIEPYLRAARLGRWNYMRTMADDENQSAVTYARLFGPVRLMEGKLINRNFLPLWKYLQSPSAATQPEGQQRPKAPLKNGAAFMFELLQPLEPFPEELAPGPPVVSSTPVIYYEYNGQVLARGKLTRTVQIEGFEAVDTPAGRFAECLRLRLDLHVQIPWMFSMHWVSYIWLSEEMGEVKRTEQMSGWFLIFHFSSTHEYQLISGQPVTAWAEPASVRPPRWQYGAVLMDRTIPRPRISGLVVDYADGSFAASQPASHPATQPTGPSDQRVNRPTRQPTSDPAP